MDKNPKKNDPPRIKTKKNSHHCDFYFGVWGMGFRQPPGVARYPQLGGLWWRGWCGAGLDGGHCGAWFFPWLSGVFFFFAFALFFLWFFLFFLVFLVFLVFFMFFFF